MANEIYSINNHHSEFEGKMEHIEKLIRNRLGEKENESCWKLGRSSISGRGIIAKKDLLPGDDIFKDIPLTLGPRGNAEGGAVCVACLRSSSLLKPCSKGCRLPLCSEICQNIHFETPECTLLRQLEVNEGDSWCPEIYRAFTPFKCLSLSKEDKDMIKILQSHPPNGLSLEMKLLYRSVKTKLCKEDEDWMDLCCRIMAAAAFQVITDDVNATLSPMRGLYALAGLANHSCMPNTRQVFTSDKRLKFVAIKPIAKGEELTTSYCPLLWATPVRIAFLSNTKHFICNCLRCQDTTEMGTYLAGLRCNCGGIVMPERPQHLKTDWKCSSCSKSLTSAQALVATSILSAQSGNTKNNLSLLPDNHIMIDIALRKLFSQRLRVHELNETELGERENKIKHIIEIIDQLQLGECRTKGLLLAQLYSTLKEKELRSSEYINEDTDEMLLAAKRTLLDDISIPDDIISRLTKFN